MEPKVVMRVYFRDDSFKTVAVEPSIKTSALLELIAEKVELDNTEGFAIFVERIAEGGGERCLEDDEEPCKNIVWDMKGVEADISEFVERTQWTTLRRDWEEHFRYVFQRRIFMKDTLLNSENAKLVHFLYIQAVDDVITGTYPCSQEDAVFLGGLQMQVDFGDHDDVKHIRGFLHNKLKRFIPATYLNSRSESEWEAEIYSEHSPVKGMSELDAKLQYLSHVRKWYFYGSLFWNVRVHNYAAVSLPQNVLLAVNCEGIHILKIETKELISSHSFTDIYSWAYKVNAFAFVSGSISRQKYQFETDYGKDIAKTLQAYVDILLERHKVAQQEVDDDDDEEDDDEDDDEDEDDEDEDDDEEDDIPDEHGAEGTAEEGGEQAPPAQ